MKSNIPMYSTIVFGVTSVGLILMSVLSFKELEKYNNQIHGAPATEKKPAILSIEEKELEPLRENIAMIAKARDEMEEKFREEHRLANVYINNLTLKQIAHDHTIMYVKKWALEAKLYQKNHTNTSEEKKKEIADYQSIVDVNNQYIARDNASYEEKKLIIQKERKEIADEVPLIEKRMTFESNRIATKVARARDNLKKYVLKSASVYKRAPYNGQIIKADPVLRTAVINLGRKDGIRRGMLFDIINENSLKQVVVKGRFKVNDLTATTASGYIIELNDINNPIIESDNVGNPFYIRYNVPIIEGVVLNEHLGPSKILISRGKSHNIVIGTVLEVFKLNQGTDRIVKADCKVIELKQNTSICALLNVRDHSIFKMDKVGTKIDKGKVKTFFLGGEFRKKFNKEVIKRKIIKFGHQVVDELTATTNYFVAGSNADDPIQKAHALNVTVMEEDSLLRYLD
ncbi:MAG: hypothetical protein COA79_05385 [Planctomycetota bacterium]|nr:MAG: hypothetical protein COA79_05385 [Planctomycetota bacterium]